MSFDDILKDGDAQRNAREAQHRRLVSELDPRCEELQSNAAAELKRAISAIDGLVWSGTPSTGFPPGIKDDSTSRGFAQNARSDGSTLEVRISGAVKVLVRDGEFKTEYAPLQIQATRMDKMPPKNQSTSFAGSQLNDELRIDETALSGAISDLVRKMT